MSVGQVLHRRATEVRWSLNYRALAIVVTLLTVGCIGGYFWHSYQVGRNAGELLERAKTLEEDAEWHKAAELVHNYLRLMPDDLEARIRLAKLFDKSAKSAPEKFRAVELYRESAALAPERDELHGRLAELLLETGNTRGALEEATVVLKRMPKDPSALRIVALSGVARTAGTQKDPAKLLAAFRRAVHANPRDIELSEHFAQLLRDPTKSIADDRSVAEADEVMDQLVSSAADDPSAWLARRRYRQRFGLAGSSEDLDAAAKLNSNNAEVLAATLDLSLRDKSVAGGEESVKLAERLIEQAPLDSRGYLALSQAHLSKNQREDAIAVLQKGRDKIGERDLALSAELVRIQTAMQNFAAARAVLASMEQTLRSLSADVPEAARVTLKAHLGLLSANLSITERDYPAAIRELQRIVTLPPLGETEIRQHTQAWSMLGDCYSTLRQWDLAINSYGKATGLLPGSLELHLRVATTLALAGRWEEAVKACEAASVLDGAAPQALLQLAEAQLQVQVRLKPNQRDLTNVTKTLATIKKLDVRSPQRYLLEASFADLQGRSSAEILRQAESEFPKDSRLLPALVMHYERGGQSKEADRLCEEFRAVGELLSYVQLRVEVLLSRKDFDSARKLVETYRSKIPPKHAFGIEALLSQINLASGEREVALDQLVAMADSRPKDLQLALSIAELSEKSGDVGLIEAAEKRLREVEGDDGCSWRVVRVKRLLAADPGQATNTTSEVTKLMEEIDGLRPDWTTGHLLKAFISRQKGDQSVEIESLQRALELGEQQPEVLGRLMELLVNQGKSAEALSLIQKHAELTASSIDVAGKALTFLIKAQHLDDAVNLAGRAAVAHSSDATPQVWLGQIYSLQKKVSEAEAALSRAVELAPTELGTWDSLFKFLLEQKKKDAALKALGQLEQAKVPVEGRSMLMAQVYETLGNGRLAGKYYLEAAEKASENVTFQRRAAVFFTGRQSRTAERLLRKVVELSPDEADARRQLAHIIARRNTKQAWKEAFELVKTESPSDRRIKVELLLERRVQEDRNEARGILEKLVGEPHATPADRLVLAALYEQDKQFDKARQELSRIVREEQVAPQVLAAYAEFLIRQNDLIEAEVWVARLERTAPQNELATVLRAQMLFSSSKSTQVDTLINKFLADPKTTTAAQERVLSEVGRLCITHNEKTGAERWFRKLIKLSNRSYQPLVNLLTEEKRFKDAILVCVRASERLQSPAPLAYLCTMLMQINVAKEDLAQAEAALSVGLKRYHDNRDLLCAAATLRSFQNRNEEAGQIFQQVLDLDPQDTMALNNYSVLLSESTEYRKAIELARRAIELEGPGADILDTLGVALVRSGEPAEGVSILEQAISGVHPKPQYLLHLAAAYAQVSKWDKAQHLLEKSAEGGLERLAMRPADQAELKQLQRVIANREK